MGYSDIIAYKVELLPPEKQIEILDFIAFLKARYLPAEIASVPKTAGEIETFFRSFMPMLGRIFIDTNIVIYALGQGSTKAHLAAPLFIDSPFISTQVLSETANAASKRLALPVSEIRTLIFTLEAMR
jgi:hypothetical protein